MLDAKKSRSEIDVAIERFVSRLAGLFAEACSTLVAAQAPSVQTNEAVSRKKPAPPKPAVSRPRRKSAGAQPTSPVRALLNRPNVHRIPSGGRPPLPAAPALTSSPSAKGPTPDEIAERVSKIVAAASLPPTLERIRLALKVTREALVPVVDRLVRDNRLRVVDVGGVILYKPPRVEPIRRKGPAPARART